jgi:hypothetical protein
MTLSPQLLKRLKSAPPREIEEWKPIPGYEATHEVSNHGRIRSLARNVATKGGGLRSVPPRIMKTGASSNGYLKVQLGHKAPTLSVHRLVAAVFVENQNALPQVNHLDGVKSNNAATNLEWVTQSQNMLHCHANNLQVKNAPRGSAHPFARAVIVTKVSGEVVGEWGSVTECARSLGLQLQSVFRVLLGHRRSHHQMQFHYK